MDPPMSISLTDAQTDAITNLARPLAPSERAGFFAELFETLLMRRDEVGDGELGRLLRDLHHRHFRPLTVDETSQKRVSRWHSKLTAATPDLTERRRGTSRARPVLERTPEATTKERQND
jgi:hypothetical protein